MPRIAVIGTDLAPLRESSGALERVVLGWAVGLERLDPEMEVVCLHARPSVSGGIPADKIRQLSPDLVVLNNRPLWGDELDYPVLHVMHNYPDAWATGATGTAEVARRLERETVCAVSRTLAHHVEERYGLSQPVDVVRVAVEECFFEQDWAGESGPVLFPNRLLEKKGVRFFIELAERLAGSGRRCTAFRHLAPFAEPTTEQKSLVADITASGAIELVEPPRSRTEMAIWYAEASVVLCPSVNPEGLGLVALEAQAVGAPLVTSGLGGLTDATFAPNEIIGSFDALEWVAAIVRATATSPSPVPLALVRDRYSLDAAAASIHGCVLRALSRN